MARQSSVRDKKCDGGIGVNGRQQVSECDMARQCNHSVTDWGKHHIPEVTKAGHYTGEGSRTLPGCIVRIVISQSHTKKDGIDTGV